MSPPDDQPRSRLRKRPHIAGFFFFSTPIGFFLLFASHRPTPSPYLSSLSAAFFFTLSPFLSLSTHPDSHQHTRSLFFFFFGASFVVVGVVCRLSFFRPVREHLWPPALKKNGSTDDSFSCPRFGLCFGSFLPRSPFLAMVMVAAIEIRCFRTSREWL